MNLEARARIAGYLSLFGMAAAVAVLGGVLISAATHPSRIIRVHFPELGTLMMDDPVAQEGVPIGKVRAIRSDPANEARSVVEIEIFTRRFIAADSRFVDFNHSLMGARTVVLVPGRSTLPLDESRVQEGLFAAGFTETLHKVGELLNLVTALRTETARLFVDSRSPWSPQRLPGELEKAIRRIHGLTVQTERATAQINSAADALMRAGTMTRKTVRNIRVSAQPAESGIEAALAAVVSAESGAETVLAFGERFLASVRDSGAIRGLLYETTAYDGLESALRLLESALSILRKDGLEGAIQYRRNIHLLRRKSR